jgi:hypothetical protein
VGWLAKLWERDVSGKTKPDSAKAAATRPLAIAIE